VASSREIQERIERVIIECGRLGVKRTPETLAEIIVDQDVHSTGVEPTDSAYAEYMATASRVLLGVRPVLASPCRSAARAEGRELTRE
jgi:hypothetical protein